MTEAVKKANEDTPDDVKVPSSYVGLAMWVAGKWGIGIPIAAVFAWFLSTVYADLRTEGVTKVEMVRGMMDLQAANVQAIHSISEAVKQNTSEIQALRSDLQHLRYQTNQPAQPR
jgi:hypothetical protein